MSHEYAEFIETLGEPPAPPRPGPGKTGFRQAVEDMRANGGAHFGVVRALGPLAGQELDVIGVIVERLKAGRLAYGPFDLANDTRDLDAEARDEVLDGLVYLAAKQVQRGGVA